MQRFSVQRQGRDHRDVRIGKFGTETVFLEYCLVAPASRPIKLCDYRLLFFDADLIDAILIAVQCQESPIAVKAQFLHRRENVIGLKLGVGER